MATALQTKAGQQRVDKKPVYGPPDLHPDLLQNYEFRFFALRQGRTQAALERVESCTWDDGAPNRGAITTGTLTVRDASYGIGAGLTLDEGDRVRCEVDSGAGFRELWTMRISDPGLSAKQGQRTFQLANDLDLLARSTDDFAFAAGKGTAHPSGLTAADVIKQVCNAYGVRVGALPDCKYRRKKSWTHRGVSPLDAIQIALNVEKQHTGRRFVVRWQQNALWITPLKRQPHLLALGQSLIEAALQSHLPRGENSTGVNEGWFASALTIRGLRNEPKGKDKKGRAKQSVHKIRAQLQSAASIAKFGYVHRVVWSPDAKTDADLVRQGNQYLSAIAKPIKELTLTHAGIPTIRRGDAIQLGLGDDALRKQIVWVTEVSFSLTPSDFQMVLTVTFDDPYVDKVAERIQDKLQLTQAAAAKRSAKNAPKPPKAKPRSDAASTGSGLPGEVDKAGQAWERQHPTRAEGTTTR